MKKLLAIALCMMLLLCSCGEKAVVQTKTSSTTSKTSTASSKTNTVCDHTYSAATCTAPKTCTKCGKTSGTSLGHNYSGATCTSPGRCTRCGQTGGFSLGHSYSGATCTSPGRCTRCGQTSGSALGHNYSGATCTSAAKCTRCGQTSGSALGHNYSSGKCTRCGLTSPPVFEFPATPVELDGRYGNFIIKSITCEAKSDEIKIKLLIEATSHEKGGEFCCPYFSMRFYDSDGILVTDDSLMPDRLRVGEKEYFTALPWYKLFQPGETYRVEFT